MNINSDPFDPEHYPCFCGGQEVLAPIVIGGRFGDTPIKGFVCPDCGEGSVPGVIALLNPPIPLWAQWGPYSTVNHNAMPPWLTYTASTVPQ